MTVLDPKHIHEKGNKNLFYRVIFIFIEKEGKQKVYY